MKRLLISLILVFVMVLPIFSITTMSADKVDEYASLVGIKQVKDNNVDITYTGNTWTDSKGKVQYEYIARINQAPIYNDNGTLVDCSWHLGGKGSKEYSIINNVFSAIVIGSSISTTYQGQTMSWNPSVYIDSTEYVAKDVPKVLAVDPINSNYQNNTLEWDYGVCVRRVRVIEGMIQETWIFSQDPKGTVWIKDNAQKSAGFTWAIAPYAYDADGNSLVINQYKQVMASEFSKAVYPVTIDPTEVYVTSASDGMVQRGSYGVYVTEQAAATGTDYSTFDYCNIGQDSTNELISRAFLYFDTATLPDSATILSCNISLYGKYDSSTTDFNISVQSGMIAGQDHYPHDPLVAADFDKTFYDVNGIGNVGFNTSGFSITGYNNISLNATGMTWISKVGVTKLCIRSTEDIIASEPSTSELVRIYAYEKGGGYQPTLYVTYASSGVPTVTTNPAAYVTKTTAQLNGYLDADGGESCNVSFEYFNNEINNSDFETGAPPTAWTVVGAGATFNRTSLMSKFNTYSANLTRAGTDTYFYQEFANYSTYKGLQITFAMWVNASVASRARLNLSDSTGSSYSSYHTGGSTWELLTVNKTIDAAATYIRVGGEVNTGNTTAYFDWGMIADGATCPVVTANQSKVNGEYVLKVLTGLHGNTMYGYRSVAGNSLGVSYGSWVYFLTSAVVGVPTNVACIADSDSVQLTWLKNASASQVYIRYKVGGYPTSITDGNAVANQSGNLYLHEGLFSGTSYYYKMWGLDAGDFSTANVTTMCTTTAGSASATPNPLPTVDMTGFTTSPNGSALENNPLYPFVNSAADELGIPHNTWWMFIGIFMLVVVGVFTYTRTGRNLLAALGAMIVLGIIMSNMALFPIWVMYVFGLAGIGMSWKELR
jgi:hypothetical protein